MTQKPKTQKLISRGFSNASVPPAARAGGSSCKRAAGPHVATFLRVSVREGGHTPARECSHLALAREIAERAGPKQQTAPATRGLRLPREASGDAAREPGGDAYP
jgi:hypothetical protein